MIVYIEYVLIDNFVIDFLLLKTTFTLTGKSYKKLRLIILSAFGAIFALVFPLISMRVVLVVIIKVLFGCLLLLLSNSYVSFKDYYINFAVFFGITFLTGGAVIGVFNLLNIDYSTEISIAFMILPVYALIRALTEVVKFIYRKKDQIKNVYDIELSFNNNVVKTKGFFDTGNQLYFNNSPVIVISKTVFLRLVKDKMPKIKEMDFSTVLGKGKMFCFNIDKLKIYNQSTPNIYNNVTVGVNKNAIDTAYSVILHPYFMGDNYVENFSGQVKKIS